MKFPKILKLVSHNILTKKEILFAFIKFVTHEKIIGNNDIYFDLILERNVLAIEECC